MFILARPCLVVIVFCVNVENISVLVSTAMRVIGVEGVCLVDSVEKDTLMPAVFTNVSKLSPQSSTMKHVITFFGQPEGSSCVVIRAMRVWCFQNKKSGSIAQSRSCAQCPRRPQAWHSVFCFQFSQLLSTIIYW